MNPTKSHAVLIILILFLSGIANSQNPKVNWKKYKIIEQSGFSVEKLAVAKAYFDSLNSSAFMITDWLQAVKQSVSE